MTPRSWRRWLRPGWSGLILLLLSNLVALFAFTLPRRLSGRQLDARLEQVEAAIEARRADNEQARQRQKLTQANVADTQRLLRRIGRRETMLVPVLAEVDGHAREVGVKSGSRTMQPEELKDLGLLRLKISVPLEGEYSRLVALLRRLELSKSFVTVDELRLAHKDGGAAGSATTLHMSLSTYFLGETGTGKAGAAGAR